jgi:hypothetical protein
MPKVEKSGDGRDKVVDDELDVEDDESDLSLAVVDV